MYVVVYRYAYVSHYLYLCAYNDYNLGGISVYLSLLSHKQGEGMCHIMGETIAKQRQMGV